MNQPVTPRNDTIGQSPTVESNPRLIAVTGGIGSGKSVVCRILSALGYPVYDCDSRAKALMDVSDVIKATLCSEVTPEAVNSDGSINRRAVATVVFNDSAKLAILDHAVHSAVIADILVWRDANKDAHRKAASAPLLFVETAIPYKSGLYAIVDDIWEVNAPEELRIARASARDNTDPSAIRARIAAQAAEYQSFQDRRLISNDGTTPLLPAILTLLSSYS